MMARFWHHRDGGGMMAQRWRTAGFLFFALVAAQVIGLAIFAAVREAGLRGTEVILQTAPVDPRSLLQGDYAILDYEIAELPADLDDLPPGSAVYVRLAESDGVWHAAAHHTGRQSPPDDGKTYIRGEVAARGRLDFGIGTYFVPEGTGHIIENAQDVKVAVSLDRSGNAAIKRVLVDGLPFDELPFER